MLAVFKPARHGLSLLKMSNQELIKLVVEQVLAQLNTDNDNIIEQLTLTECAYLIHGIKGNEKTDFILEHSNKKQFKIKKISDSNHPLYPIYKQELVKLGYIFLCEDKKEEPVKTNCKKFVLTKKVISERDLIKLQLKKKDCLHIFKQAIITPLARDYIKSNSIEIIKED